MKNNILALFLCFFSCVTSAQNWDYIITSDDYYYGEGRGKTVNDATNAAKAAISGMISTTVKSVNDVMINETNKNGTINSNVNFSSYVKTYSAAILNNVRTLPPKGKEPEILVRAWVSKADVDSVFADRGRIVKAYVGQAEECLANNMIKETLENYYYAYVCLCSMPNPSMVKDETGKSIAIGMSTKIKEILNDIDVKYQDVVGDDRHSMLFTYKGNKVQTLEFYYNDGNTDKALAKAKDGIGVLEMSPEYKKDVFHINIKLSFIEEASYEPTLKAIADLAPAIFYKENQKVVERSGSTPGSQAKLSESQNSKAESSANGISSLQNSQAGMNLNPTSGQVVEDAVAYKNILDNVLEVIKSRQYSQLVGSPYFTPNGYDVFCKLMKYGQASIVGTPEMHFFKGPKGTVVARGLQMSFSFKTSRHKTFVEDVAFTFDARGKIDNIAFGLGQEATNDLLCKDTPNFTSEARELVVEFLENYKTAYCLEREDYIGTIFSDSAVIITGYVAKVKSNSPVSENSPYIDKQQVKYKRHTKNEYMKHLAGIFRKNEFINIHFAENTVLPLFKIKNKKMYGISIKQDYTSSSYSDKGFLFLLVDMTDIDEPTIIVRTWQPDAIDPDSIIGIGDFFK